MITRENTNIAKYLKRSDKKETHKHSLGQSERSMRNAESINLSNKYIHIQTTETDLEKSKDRKTIKIKISNKIENNFYRMWMTDVLVNLTTKWKKFQN